MTVVSKTELQPVADIIDQLSQNLTLDINQLCLFSDRSEFLLEALSLFSQENSKLYVVGHATPDLEIVADRAKLKLTELLAHSPFSADIEILTSSPVSATDIIYLSNPNRTNGTALSLASLEMLANAVPEGLLIVDEQYFDYYGITANSLLKCYHQILVLRSFTTSYGITSAESGFAAGSPDLLSPIIDEKSITRISATTRKIVATTLSSPDVRTKRLAMVHGESLRVSAALTQLGIQNRITATDFILLRVKDPAAVGNALAKHRVSVDNLDGYPGLKNYLRYRVLSPESNDFCIRAFSRMTLSLYKMKTPDMRITTLRKKGEEIDTANRIKQRATLPPMSSTSRNLAFPKK